MLNTRVVMRIWTQENTEMRSVYITHESVGDVPECQRFSRMLFDGLADEDFLIKALLLSCKHKETVVVSLNGAPLEDWVEIWPTALLMSEQIERFGLMDSLYFY